MFFIKNDIFIFQIDKLTLHHSIQPPVKKRHRASALCLLTPYGLSITIDCPTYRTHFHPYGCKYDHHEPPYMHEPLHRYSHSQYPFAHLPQ